LVAVFEHPLEPVDLSVSRCALTLGIFPFRAKFIALSLDAAKRLVTILSLVTARFVSHLEKKAGEAEGATEPFPV
jgi:hypothetical protein